jgi:hypothetical protein
MMLWTREEISEDIILAATVLSVDGDVALQRNGKDRAEQACESMCTRGLFVEDVNSSRVVAHEQHAAVAED